MNIWIEHLWLRKQSEISISCYFLHNYLWRFDAYLHKEVNMLRILSLYEKYIHLLGRRDEAEFGFYPELLEVRTFGNVGDKLWDKIYKCGVLLYLKCHWVVLIYHEYFKLLTCCHNKSES